MQGLEMLSPQWEDYELIDSGGFEKLERFGKYVTVRPEPQAIWDKSLPVEEWERMAGAIFRREGNSEERGRWLLAKGMPEQWWINYRRGGMSLRMRMGLTSFKHVGVFPEQAENWNFIYDNVRKIISASTGSAEAKGAKGAAKTAASDAAASAEAAARLTGATEVLTSTEPAEMTGSPKNSGAEAKSAAQRKPSAAAATEKPGSTLAPGAAPRVLNLFAYTGGASLAARSAGADVTHVDSVRQVVSWSRENMEASGLSDIRWIVDDALKLVRREVKRGRKYNGIILDPPAYGRGPDGEKWVLEQNLSEILALCAELLEPRNSFLVLNLYSMGFSALLAKSAVNRLFPTPAAEQFGELYFSDRAGKMLPLGVYYRCSY